MRIGDKIACAQCAPQVLGSLSADEREEVDRQNRERKKSTTVRPALTASGRFRTQTPKAKTPQAGPAPEAWPQERKRRILFLAGGGGGALLVILLLFVVGTGGPAPRRSSTARQPEQAAPIRKEEPAQNPSRGFDIRSLEDRARNLLAKEEFGAARRVLSEARERPEAEGYAPVISRMIQDARLKAEGLYGTLKPKAMEAKQAGRAAEVADARSRVAKWGMADLVSDLERALTDSGQPPAPEVGIVLSADQAKLSGSGIRLLGQKENAVIEGWGDPAARAEWTFNVTRPGDYRVEVVYSCAPDAGGDFSVDFAGAAMDGKAESTGSWSTFAARLLQDTVELPAGPLTVAVKPGRIAKGLMNLMRLRLVPAQ